MSYGITAYRTEKALVSEYVVTAYRQKNVDTTYEVNYHTFQQLEQLFSDPSCITPKEALTDIFSGRITRTDPMSGAVYRYVSEVAFRVCDIVERLPNEYFYPFRSEAVSEIFSRYSGFLIDGLPAVSDFPLTAYLSNAELKKLQQDYSFLKIPEECKKQFESWINVADQTFLVGGGELLLFYY